MSINIQVKEPLESKVNKAFTKLVAKNQFVSNKNDFIMKIIENGVADLYKNKSIS